VSLRRSVEAPACGGAAPCAAGSRDPVRRRGLARSTSTIYGAWLMAAGLRAGLSASVSASLAATLSATLAAGLAIATAAAAAADLGPKDYSGWPARSFAVGWAGPYVGATLGYEWSNVANNPARPRGLAAGLEAGFDWQSGTFVYGGEIDISFSAADDTFAPWQFSNPWFGTVRGRAGAAINNVLLFGTAGFAYGELTGTISGNFSESHTSFGWVAGLGGELSLTQNWSAKAEWLYLDLADRRFTVTATNNGLAANLVRLGLNYRF
jgi:outer membrane immunogenic protein